MRKKHAEYAHRNCKIHFQEKSFENHMKEELGVTVEKPWFSHRGQKIMYILNGLEKMKVKICNSSSQPFSCSRYVVMPDICSTSASSQGTVDLVSNLDEIFDCLNSSLLYGPTGKHSKVRRQFR